MHTPHPSATIVPMLKRDDLVRKLADFPPPEATHPLLAYPAIAELIARNVSEESAAGTRSYDFLVAATRHENRIQRKIKLRLSYELETKASAKEPVDMPRYHGSIS